MLKWSFVLEPILISNTLNQSLPIIETSVSQSSSYCLADSGHYCSCSPHMQSWLLFLKGIVLKIHSKLHLNPFATNDNHSTNLAMPWNMLLIHMFPCGRSSPLSYAHNPRFCLIFDPWKPELEHSLVNGARMRPAKISDIHPNHESATVSLMSNKLLIEPIPSLTDNDLQAQTPSAPLSYCKAIE